MTDVLRTAVNPAAGIDRRGADLTGTDFGKVAVVSGVLLFVVLQIVAAWHAGWVFEYPLDDTYIHLAMASQIAHGGYGINAGEYASAASSPLYPVLLAFMPDTPVQRYLPLLWNTVGMVLTLWLWGRALVWAGYRGWQGWVMAAIVPVATGAISVAYTGMEHTLQAAASVAIVFGLARFLIEKRLNAILFVGLLFGPAFRFEDLALATMAILVLFAHRRFGAGLLGLALAFVPVAIFIWFLVHIGLSPLPNSIQAKLVSHEDVNMPFIQRAVGTLQINMSKFGGIAISGLTATLLFLTVVTATLQNRTLASVAWLAALAGVAALSFFSTDLDTWDTYMSPAITAVIGGSLIMMLQLVMALRGEETPSPLAWFALALAVSAFGHLVLAQIGWMERYEHYLIVVLTLGCAIVAGLSGAAFRWSSMVAVAAMFMTAAYYVHMIIPIHSWASRAINAQQAQMARFAKDYLKRNVAVNDIGRVAWANPNYVLDLWGLANDEARWIRLHDPEPGWAGPLADEHNVSVIMIYDKWLADAVGPTWVPLGKLIFLNPRGYLGDVKVTFYARNAQEVPHAEAALAAWKKTLVKDTCFIPMDEPFPKDASECGG